MSRAKSEDDLIRRYDLFEKVLLSISRFPLVSFDRPAALLFTLLKSMKFGVKPMDLRIASIAFANDLTLVTRNTSDFARIPNIKLEDWTK